MTTTRIRYALYIVIAIGALLVLFLRFRESGPALVAGDTRIPVTIADTQSKRAQGLSGTTGLARGSGKLFVFPEPGVYGFWMKDMRYPIDIVWIDPQWQVVGTSRNLSPDTYPTIFYPPQPVQYVLEVSAGDPVVDNVVQATTLVLELAESDAK